MFLLIMVLDDSTRLNEILKGWVEAGVKGVTVLESTGLNRILPREAAQPAFMGFSNIFGGGRVGHNTLLAVIEETSTADRAAQVAEEILGDLNKPDTGIIFLMPVIKSWGLPEPFYSQEHPPKKSAKSDSD